MNIRPAKPTDQDVVPEMMLQAMEDIVFTFIGKTDVEEAISFLNHFYCKPANQYSYENTFVAVDEEDEEVIGSITAYDGGDLDCLRSPITKHIEEHYKVAIQAEAETEAGELYLDTLSVSPRAQGKGVGSALLRHLLAEAKVKGFKRVGLLVDQDNPNAQRLYERLGFQLGIEKIFLGTAYNHMYFDL